MNKENIWSGFDFSEEKLKTAFDYLTDQKENFDTATKSILKMDIEAVDSLLYSNPPKPVAIYIMHIVAPKLGNYRKKILSVAEFREEGRFPVDIVCHLDNDRRNEVQEVNFLKVIQEVLSKTLVQGMIENLYKQSIDVDKTTPKSNNENT